MIDELFMVEDWEVDPKTHQISQNGIKVKLEPRLMSLLTFLVDNAGEVVSKDKIIDFVWQDVFVSEQALKVAISELRKSLNDDAKKPKYIRTIPTKGYQFIAKVNPVKQNSQNAHSLSISKPVKQNRQGWLLGILGILSVLAIAVFAGWNIYSTQNSKDNLSKIDSIAVLPLRDISENPSEEFFSHGLTEAITTDLTKRSLLKVISPRSALIYKNSDKTPMQIAADLDVEALVDGTILRMGQRVRLNVNLIDGRGGQIVWSETYERNLDNILDLQAKLSFDVARQIDLNLSSPKTKATKVDSEAYDNYLKGRYLWNKRTKADIQKSIPYFQKAISLEPENALYHSGLADSYILLAYYSPRGSKDFYEKAKDAAQKALELDDTLAEAHASLGGILHKYNVDLEGAEREFQTAIKLNPNYATARQWYAIYLMSISRHEEAIKEIDKGLELDPLSYGIRADKGWLFYMAKKYEQAITQLKEINMLESKSSAYYFLILGYCKKGLFEEAIAIAEKSISKRGRNANNVSLLAYSQILAGKKKEGLANFEEIKKMPKGKVSPFQLALIYLALGDEEKALDNLEMIADNHRSWRLFLKSEPSLEKLNSHPRFNKLIRRIGLTP